jgi:regulator of protease activity HflC (stomatin/prohibitin superfamily)
MDNLLIGVVVFVIFIIVILVKTAVVVDQQYEYVIERLGK